MKSIRAKDIFHLIFVVALLFLVGGCNPQPQVAATSTSTSPAASATPTRKVIPTRTPTPRAVLPVLRTPEPREALPREGTVEFHIIHWNDFHGELVENDLTGVWIPGAARLAAFVKTEKEKYDPGQVLILDAGDWFEGTSVVAYSNVGKVWELYKQLGVNAATVGNHELFLGMPRFYQMVSQAAPMEILSVNMRKTKDKACSDKRILNPYKIFEMKNTQGFKVRVAVIGISAYALEDLAYAPITAVCFIRPEEEVLKFYDQMMETEHPDVVVVLSHSGLSLDHDFAKAMNAAGKPVDIIIGGHSHSWIDAAEKEGNTIIVTAGERGRAVGVLDLVFDRARSKLDVQWREEIFSFCSPEDSDTLAFLQDVIPASVPKKECLNPKNPDYSYLIDMKPISESVGFWTLGKGKYPASDEGMINDQVISSHGTEYPNGLFAHASSKLRFTLDGNYTSFATTISIKETACGDGASFVVNLDGKEIYRFENMLASSEPIPLTLDVTGGKILELLTISGADMSCDWTIWGDPYLVKE